MTGQQQTARIPQLVIGNTISIDGVSSPASFDDGQLPQATDEASIALWKQHVRRVKDLIDSDLECLAEFETRMKNYNVFIDHTEESSPLTDDAEHEQGHHRKVFAIANARFVTGSEPKDGSKSDAVEICPDDKTEPFDRDGQTNEDELRVRIDTFLATEPEYRPVNPEDEQVRTVLDVLEEKGIVPSMHPSEFEYDISRAVVDDLETGGFVATLLTNPPFGITWDQPDPTNSGEEEGGAATAAAVVDSDKDAVNFAEDLDTFRAIVVRHKTVLESATARFRALDLRVRRFLTEFPLRMEKNDLEVRLRDARADFVRLVPLVLDSNRGLLVMVLEFLESVGGGDDDDEDDDMSE